MRSGKRVPLAPLNQTDLLTMPLSEREKAELPRLGVTEDVFFDAGGRTVGACRAEMEAVQKYFANNTTSCRKEGHTIRTIRGHCLCNGPAVSRYLAKLSGPGYVYLAVSQRGKLFKIGITRSLSERSKTLGSRRTAGQWDWEMVWSEWLASPGEIENKLHASLIRHRVDNLHTWNDLRKERSSEIFRCNWHDITAAFSQILPNSRLRIPTQWEEADLNFIDPQVSP